ncbi:hypothetical protein [Streptomyces sp. NBC_00063]|uniref:hypothetical protein n=2 Tax=Streptomyces TaxID=1883 RepID=UPI003EBF4702
MTSPTATAVAHARERAREHYVGGGKLMIDRAQNLLVGATFAGSGTADLVHQATTTIVGGVPASVLWHVVPNYLTRSEV